MKDIPTITGVLVMKKECEAKHCYWCNFEKQPPKKIELMLVIKEHASAYKRAEFVEQVNGIRKMLRAVEQEFNLPAGAFDFRHKKTGNPVRAYDGISIADIRMALTVILINEMSYHPGIIADALQIDRTTVLHHRNLGRTYLRNEDQKFMDYYEVVYRVWKTADEIKFTLCKHLVPSHHEQPKISNATTSFEFQHRGIFERQAV